MAGLSEETLEVARQELREDESTRQNALRQIKEWAVKNPRIISCREDDSFFLRFLRCKKFSVVMAQEAIERYMLLRQVWSVAFCNLDYTLPSILQLIDLGYIMASPGRDNLGRRWIIYRPGVFDPHKFLNADMLRVHGVVYETLMEDEESQIRGFVHFADGAGVSFPHLTLFTPREAVRIVKNGERTIPMRHKEVYGINVLPALKFALDFGMGLISEKIKKRVTITTTLEESLEIIGENKRMLPLEYGGDIPMEEMIASFKEELKEKRSLLLQSDEQLKVNLEMFSEGAKAGSVSALKGKCSAYNDINVGSFRKLQVD